MTTPSTDFRRNYSEERPNFYKEGTKSFTSDSPMNMSISTAEVSSASLSANAQAPYVPSKPHMLPVVYFQTPTSTTKPNTNVLFNTVQLSQNGPSLPISNNLSVPSNQSVILAKPQQLVIQKTTGSSLLPINVSTNNSLKNTVALLTMIKPIAKPQEIMSNNRVQLNTVCSDNIQIIPNMASVNPNPGQKYLLTPMPKISTNRLPVTATTNSNMQSKIAFMPLQVQNKAEKTSKAKVINLKIANGLQSETPIALVCDGVDKNTEKTETKTNDIPALEPISSSKNTDKKAQDQEDKSYQLSIVEDSSSRNDVSYTISIPDDTKPTEPQLKDLKYTKQGISILKKSFPLERKSSKSNYNTITTVSDIREVSKSNSAPEIEEIATSTPILKTKPERRRKSNFSYRKDYDEVELENNKKPLQADSNAFTKFLEAELEAVKNAEEEMDVDSSKKSVIVTPSLNDNMEKDDCLFWDQDVGALPGSNLRFEINEFGILEVMSEEEAKKYIQKVNNNKLKDVQEDLCCQECGCYGLPADFVSNKYCSTSCQEAGENEGRGKFRKKRKRNLYKNEKDSSEDDIPSNENSQDKTYPWNCAKKGFSWSKYLDHTKAIGAPVKLFKDPFPYTRNGFRVGMKLEGIDPQHPKYFCVLTVNEVLGYRIRLHFDGYSDNYDFWKNADSLDIFPIGWCEKNGHTLHPPPNYGSDEFNWTTYLRHTKSTAAPKQLFASRLPNHCPNAFRVGMKLEAVDRKNTALVCVATIADMMDNRILVHFDSWDDIYDYWAEPTSPYIHPVGWCDQNGHDLTPPNDYPNPKLFTWDSYLQETKSVAAPVRAFKQRPANGFKPGMKLECVDKRVPHLIRIATVDAVRDHQVRIKFDGWPDKYSYWVDDDCSDIHPMGWCYKTGHPLEPPLTSDDVYDFLECATAGCKGQGHIEGAKYPTHNSTKYCPYADENIDLERSLPDRLLSPDREIESVVPVSREPKENVRVTRRVGRPPKYPRVEPPVPPKVVDEIEEEEEEIEEEKPKRKIKQKSVSPTADVVKIEPPSPNGYSTPVLEVKPTSVWEKHCQYLKQYIDINSNPRQWSEQDVLNFVESIPSCRNHTEQFMCNGIDGDTLLMLTQEDLINVLNFKIGPAIKLYNSILLLRKNMLNEFT